MFNQSLATFASKINQAIKGLTDAPHICSLEGYATEWEPMGRRPNLGVANSKDIRPDYEPEVQIQWLRV